MTDESNKSQDFRGKKFVDRKGDTLITNTGEKYNLKEDFIGAIAGISNICILCSAVLVIALSILSSIGVAWIATTLTRMHFSEDYYYVSLLDILLWFISLLALPILVEQLTLIVAIIRTVNFKFYKKVEVLSLFLITLIDVAITLIITTFFAQNTLNAGEIVKDETYILAFIIVISGISIGWVILEKKRNWFWHNAIKLIDLGSTSFEDNALDLTGADFTNAKFGNTNLTGANLNASICINTDFTGTKLDGTILNSPLIRRFLTGNNLSSEQLAIFCSELKQFRNLGGIDFTSVLSSQNYGDIFRGVDLEGVDLSKANLAGLNLENANLKNAILENAILSSTNLDGADLTNAFLKGINLENASLKRAVFVGADLQNAILTRANLENTNLTKASLIGADLESACLQGAILVSTDMRRINLVRVNLENANLKNAILENAILSSTNLDGADLTNAFLKGINLENASLKSAILVGTDLQNAILSEANLEKANLTEASLIRANLERACLKGAILVGANMRGAKASESSFCKIDLNTETTSMAEQERETGADLRDADLTNANLTDANLEGSILLRTKAIGTQFTRARFTGACIQEWSIGKTTRFDEINCKYIFITDRYLNKCPSISNFKDGDFERLCEEHVNSIQILFEMNSREQEFAGLLALETVINSYPDAMLAGISITETGYIQIKILSYNSDDLDNIQQDHARIQEKILDVLEKKKFQIQEEGSKIFLIPSEPESESEIIRTHSILTEAVEQNEDSETLNNTNKDLDKVSTVHCSPKQGHWVSVSKWGISLFNAIKQIRPSSLIDLSGVSFSINPTTVTVSVTPTMTTDTNQSQAQTGSTSVSIQGSVTGTLNTGTILGDVTNIINALPKSSDPNEKGIRELLEDLKGKINSSADLPQVVKDKTLEQLARIAQSCQEPQTPEKKSLFENAFYVIKGMVYRYTNFLSDCEEIFAKISSLFGG
ncbi:pentapeptide repeat-containing protein [Pseudanabaena sp. SR411]|uniref:pentapeptide repeat-containing protein n=1 Tax=Pseudanabaena sp. SR411 TaxID=1980935 RepID=UPI0015957FEE|nr:pentapeptide repeat-containing protein [Pseudanabaena sp. SR411]